MISLFPTRNASFISKYSIEDSVDRLASIVKKDNLLNRLRGGGVLGIVKRDKVVVRYFHPLNIFSGGIQFHGLFTKQNGVTVLTGKFQCPKFGQILLTAWLALTVILFIYSIRNLELLAAPISMLILWIASILIGHRWGRTDIEHISKTIINDSLK